MQCNAKTQHNTGEGKKCIEGGVGGKGTRTRWMRGDKLDVCLEICNCNHLREILRDPKGPNGSVPAEGSGEGGGSRGNFNSRDGISTETTFWQIITNVKEILAQNTFPSRHHSPGCFHLHIAVTAANIPFSSLPPFSLTIKKKNHLCSTVLSHIWKNTFGKGGINAFNGRAFGVPI